MTEGFDAAGDAITGAMIARAVEPAHGEASESDQHAHGPCLNCGEPLAGAYCAACGQSTHIHRSLAAIGHDLLHGVLHFEGKIWRTLPELALRPGKLTRRYIQGERAKFVSPFALFLFSAFLMYAMYSLTSHEDGSVGNIENDPQAVQEMRAELATAKATKAELQKQIAAPDVEPAERADLQEQLEEAQSDIEGLDMVTGVTQSVTSGDFGSGSVGDIIRKAGKNPELAYYKLKANSYKYSWALILISIPFIWLLFPFRRNTKIYDHAIYATYSIAFMSLLFSLSMILSGVGLAVTSSSSALVLFAAWHMYRQLKDSYQLSRAGALLRLPLLYLFAAISLALFFAFVTAMS